MKVFTVLGLVNKDKAKYYYDDKLEKDFSLNSDRYTNMLTLLLDNFETQSVHAIFTKTAREVQKKVIKKDFSEDFNYQFDDRYFIRDEKDFYDTFKILNAVIDECDEDTIIDLTHSFRHIPILATISLISKNLQNEKNVKHIFFAKEIYRSSKDDPELNKYEIIDLKEYLEIANLSLMLENFSDNYTLTSNTEFGNEEYQELTESLRDVSNAFLANSIKRLYEANLLKKTKLSLEKISKKEIFIGYKSSFDKTIDHINYLLKLEELNSYERLYSMSKLMNEKGYLLNAITLIHEAVGFYCVESLKNLSEKIKNSFESYLQTKATDTNYNLSKFATTFVEKGHLKRGYKEDKILHKKHDDIIRGFLREISGLSSFQQYIKDVKNFRNNLTHANSSDKIENSKSILAGLQRGFKTFCIEKDILKRV